MSQCHHLQTYRCSRCMCSAKARMLGFLASVVACVISLQGGPLMLANFFSGRSSFPFIDALCWLVLMLLSCCAICSRIHIVACSWKVHWQGGHVVSSWPTRSLGTFHPAEDSCWR